MTALLDFTAAHNLEPVILLVLLIAFLSVIFGILLWPAPKSEEPKGRCRHKSGQNCRGGRVRYTANGPVSESYGLQPGRKGRG